MTTTFISSAKLEFWMHEDSEGTQKTKEKKKKKKNKNKDMYNFFLKHKIKHCNRARICIYTRRQFHIIVNKNHAKF